ncbi:MAG: NAD-dependent epimerase/dehydratase family protein [Flavobacterium sp.]|nr:MAG: NAD-dependent epimerase/dehydratase family protein [Flavobacterium sp.]
MEEMLLTGASGFLGEIISKDFPMKICKLGRSAHMDIVCDLATNIPNLSTSFKIVTHAAGKAHTIPKTDVDKRAFFDINVNGLNNLFKGLERCTKLPESFILISSVSVYGLDFGIDITEDYPLEAKDPYGMSKIEAENLAFQWCELNKVKLTILRLPLIAGNNPPGNLGAMITGIEKGYYMNIGNGNARKSIVLGSDVARVIPTISNIGGTYNLTDGYNPSFFELSSYIARELGKRPSKDIPLFIAKGIAMLGDILGAHAPLSTMKLNKVLSTLTFSDQKIKNTIDWEPISVLEGLKL